MEGSGRVNENPNDWPINHWTKAIFVPNRCVSHLKAFADVWYGSVDIGNDFGSLDLGSDRMTAYDVGFGRALGDIGKVDLRFYDSNYTSGRGVVTISADF